MKENTLKLFCIFLFFCTSLNAQRETANWFFGVNAGLDFNSGTPVILDNGQVNTLEGCSTISDANGALLFYTDGVTVWNRVHGIMSNGTDLIGSQTSTQSSIIIPNPGNPNIYYIFTTDVVDAYSANPNQSNGFNYSIVDISLAGGLGAVTTKNINLLSSTSEKVSASLSSDGNYWVVTHRNNQFFSFKVTAAGVDTNPVTSNVLPNISDYRNIRGSMKISPNGRKLAIAHTLFEPVQAGSLYLYDFDSATGLVSNSEFLENDLMFYGVEFSSNSSKLYASGKLFSGATANMQLQQYDVNATDVPSTKYIVHNYLQAQVISSLAGSLQLGMDKRIYHSLPGNKLSTINTANLAGADCNFDFQSVDLGFSSARFGLPASVQSYYESIATIENFCFGDATSFTVTSDNTIISIDWNFGDPASGSNNTSTLISPTHTFSSSGSYTVTINVAFSNAPSQLFTEVVVIQETPSINSLFILEQCDVDDNDSDGLSIFNLQEAITIIEEDNGSADINISFYESMNDAQMNENSLTNFIYANTVNSQVLYARVFSYIDCFAIAQIRLQVNSGTNLGVYDTIDVCEVNGTGISITQVEDTLENDFPGATIGVYNTRNDALLQDNQLSDASPININIDGELFFRVSYGTECGFIGSIMVNIVAQPEIGDQQAFLCGNEGATVLLSFEETYASYLWSTNATTSSIEVAETGVYTVIISNTAGCEKEIAFVVAEEPSLTIDRIEVQDFQDVNAINIIVVEENNPESIFSYSINGGTTFSESNEFVNVYPGVYDIVVKRGECNAASETILVGGFPKFFTPNGDSYNDTWQLLQKEYYPNAIIELYDRYGKNLNYIKANSEWDGTYKGVPLPSGDYWYKLVLENGRVITGNVTLKR
ncbi:T9SS type B sorting domain-containing protein [Kordia sp. YSTF-M3]|uniref:T9SS type B sorting domain-containing protein n=1 Tax=Kordia aestuariivivens TaxID=2759037 RepID=A0ABR7Q831_9FLAO|nr:T9SS type B sorting domain-containing protein [Kordia aestuariivivens]MBC8754506.1 T9SS type B sorting domain-containing protein [Kordia aestuariivivens]